MPIELATDNNQLHRWRVTAYANDRVGGQIEEWNPLDLTEVPAAVEAALAKHGERDIRLVVART